MRSRAKRVPSVLVLATAFSLQAAFAAKVIVRVNVVGAQMMNEQQQDAVIDEL